MRSKKAISDSIIPLSEVNQIMYNFAITKGVALPEHPLNSTKQEEIKRYNQLIELIKPVTLESLLFVEESTEGNKNFKWYQLPLLKKCNYLALFSLLLLIGTSLSDEVNTTNQGESVLSLDGWVLFYNLIFICAAASLGTMFNLLKSLIEKIRMHTLLPIDEKEINSKIIFGIIAGFLVAEMFEIPFDIGQEGDLQKVSLALLGGFSSDAIFTILQGIVNRIKLFVTPS